MTMFIPGSEIFSSRPVDPEELRRSLPPGLVTHSVRPELVDELDPLTYEVVRHRLWSVTDEMGEALKRMSGSPIVTDANDFDFAICDELGQEVQVGLYNTMLVGAVDLAIYWTLRHRSANPGIAEGDMFLCNDPWVGGGLHQNDVIVYQPVFHDGQLFAWTSAIAHQPDLGGVGLGSFSPAAQDVFSESLPTPPVKVVRDGQLQRDVADLWVRRSRVPLLIGLDLRAKIGANNVGRERLHALIDQYGADTHGTSVPMGLILASAGKAVAQNAGLCGGHPGNTGLDVIARNSRISELLAAGHMPSDLAEISGTLEPGQNYADPRRL
jgi:N-methylhydantoinase B